MAPDPVDAPTLEFRALAGRGMRLPASMRVAPTPGTCRWCGEPILREDGAPDRRRRWHPACVTFYRICTVPRDARRALRRRDKSRCAFCPPDAPKVDSKANRWHADHVVPLWRCQGEPAMYGLDNQQTLCTAHHVEKTRRDVAEYFEWRREQKQKQSGEAAAGG